MPPAATRAPVVVTARALSKGLPMGDVIYVTQPNGARFKACSCIRDSWPTITALAVSRGLIRQQISVTQGSYSTSVDASALTHAGGGVLDVQVTGAALDALLEECGIAAYERTEADGFTPHSHILWIGCPHLHDQAAAQVTSWRNLRNGLRSNTLDRDKTRPSPIRNWEQGLAWATAQLAQLEDDMPYTRDQLLEIVETAVARQLWAPLVPDRSDVGGSSVRNNLLHQSLAATQTLALVRDLAARSGIDVDEAAIARDLVAGITPALVAAVTAKLDGVAGVDAAALARELVAELGAALAPTV